MKTRKTRKTRTSRIKEFMRCRRFSKRMMERNLGK
jgi:hypothetical protein